MGLFDFLLGRPLRICDAQSLADFIDHHGAFIAQKGVYEYSRARAGHYAKILFNEPAFLEAAERARWQAFPIGLAMVAELVEGVLRSGDGDAQRIQREALNSLVLTVFDRYPVPAALGDEVWRDVRVELARRLQLIGLHPVKRAMDVAEPFADAYFSLMPIHERLRGSDFPTMHNYLRISLCNVHDELTKRMDAPVLAAALKSVPS